MELAVLIISFLLLLAAGMSVSFALGLLGMAGLFLVGGFSNLDPVGIVAWSATNSFLLTAIPLFIFMGEIILRAGFGKELFDAAAAFFGKMRGGAGNGHDCGRRGLLGSLGVERGRLRYHRAGGHS